MVQEKIGAKRYCVENRRSACATQRLTAQRSLPSWSPPLAITLCEPAQSAV
jgi:hypothetical protein